MAEETSEIISYILGPSRCRVIISGLNLDNITDVDCTSSVNFGTGRTSITAIDPDRTSYSLFQSGDKIEIYMQLGDVANKVWSGYVESSSLNKQGGNILKISGRELSSRLLNQKFDHNLSTPGELSAAFITIMGHQTDFDTNNIAATTGKTVAASFTNETIFNALKKLCDQWSYYFGIDVDGSAYMFLQSQQNLSPDTLTWGDNIYQNDTIEENKEFLLNSVLVQSSATVSATASDTSSQDSYLIHSKAITVADLSTTAAAQAYANALIATYKDPLNQIKIVSTFMANTIPSDYVTISAPTMELGGNYQCVELQHKWNRSEGIRTIGTYGRRLTDQSIWLGNLQSRVQLLEQQTFG